MALVALFLPFGSLASVIPARNLDADFPSREEIAALFNHNVIPIGDEGTTPNRKREIFLRGERNARTCEAMTSTYEDQTNADPPATLDCENLCNGMWEDYKGAYSVKGDGGLLWLTSGECAFAAMTPRGADALIGNVDVTILINEPIRKFNKNQKVGAKGVVRCKNLHDQREFDVQVTWALFKI